jgi:hypothetical protein
MLRLISLFLVMAFSLLSVAGDDTCCEEKLHAGLPGLATAVNGANHLASPLAPTKGHACVSCVRCGGLVSPAVTQISRSAPEPVRAPFGIARAADPCSAYRQGLHRPPIA